MNDNLEEMYKKKKSLVKRLDAIDNPGTIHGIVKSVTRTVPGSPKNNRSPNSGSNPNSTPSSPRGNHSNSPNPTNITNNNINLDDLNKEKVVLGTVHVLYNFEAQNEGELELKEGEEIMVLEKGVKENSEWWLGENKQGVSGYFPHNYVSEFTVSRSEL